MWKTTAYDQHDTLVDEENLWRTTREALGLIDPTDPDYLALQQSLPHADTPTRSFVDAMGRPFLAIAHNKDGATDLFYETRTTLDIEGYPKTVKDANGRNCQTHAFSMAGQLLAESNIDRGERYRIATVMGELLRKADKIDDIGGGHDRVFRAKYDVLRRPTHLYVKSGADDEILLERRYYGDDAELTDPEDDNLKGKLVALYDQAGLVELGPFDFKGNLLESARTLAKSYDVAIDWSPIDAETDVAAAKTAASADLETETFNETREYDALNRITSFTAPDASEYIPTYNEASLLEVVDVKVRGAVGATTFVASIAYNEKGQRVAVEWGNGATTEYTYDPQTYRLKRLQSERAASPTQLQDLAYTFDAVGNVCRIADSAQQTVIFDSASVGPVATFLYDAVYRLIEATGREHMSIGGTQVDENDCPLENLPHPNQATAVRNYTESYSYDQVGNILEMFHDAVGSPHATWTRDYTYATGTNRLATTSAPGPSTVTYSHDAFGNMISMPHLSGGISSNAFDQMVHASNGTQDTYFTYDAGGQRVRKVYETNANLRKERIYLGSYEIYREIVPTATPPLQLQRDTIHVMDGARRVAMVETKTIDSGSAVGSPVDLYRFQLDNHLGSACLELDGDANVISYEEYAPYGSTSYRASASATEVSARRYRYTGKERDEETGLYYYGARYYAAWLGRWTSADPLGLQAGVNLYLYCRAGPVTYVDPDGMAEKPASADKPQTAMSIGICKVDGSAETFATGAGVASEKAIVADRERTSRAPDPKAQASDWKGLPPGDYLKTDSQLEAERKAKVLAPLSQVGGVQDPVLGAVAGLIVAWEVSSLKAAKLAQKVVGFGLIATQANHEGEGFWAALGGGLVAAFGTTEPTKKGPSSPTSNSPGTTATGAERPLAQADQVVGEQASAVAGPSEAVAQAAAPQIDRAAILRTLRAQGRPEAAATAKLLKRGDIELKLNLADPGGKGRGGFHTLGTNQIDINLEISGSLRSTSSIVAHETRHWLQGISTETYHLGHEVDAYKWQSRAFGFGWTDQDIDKIIRDSGLYKNVRPSR